MKPSRTFAFPVTLLAGLIPIGALAAFSVGDTVGTTADEVRAKLTEQGYTVEEIEIEDGKIEAEYVADGQRYEIYVAADTGAVLEIELEDDDGDDDD